MPCAPRWTTFLPRPGVSLGENLRQCGEQGVDRVEVDWRVFYRDEQVDEARAEAIGLVFAEAGVRLVAVHGPCGEAWSPTATDPADRARTKAAWLRLLRLWGATGIPLAVIHPSAGRCAQPDRPLAAGRLLAMLEELLPAACASGVRLAVENLPPGRLGSRPEELLAVIEAVGQKALSVCFDTGHAHLNRRLVEDHRALLPVIGHYHLHDNDQLADRHLLPPEGSIPWAPFWRDWQAAAPTAELTIEVAPGARRSNQDLIERMSALWRTCLGGGYPRLAGKDWETGGWQIDHAPKG